MYDTIVSKFRNSLLRGVTFHPKSAREWPISTPKTCNSAAAAVEGALDKPRKLTLLE